MTRRAFIKSFSLSLAAVSCPIDFSGTKLIKLENRFKRGEFIYFKFGPNSPIELVEDIHFWQFPDKIEWDNKMDRIKLLKNIIFCSCMQQTCPEFEAYVSSIFKFCIAMDCCFESSVLLLEAIAASNYRTACRLFADVYVSRKEWEEFRRHHREYFHNEALRCSEDVVTQRDYCRNPNAHADYRFSEEDKKKVDTIVSQPGHWLYPHLKEHKELN